MYEKALDNIILAASKAIPISEEDYVNELDGLLYCGNCKTPKQVIVEVFGKRRTPMCLCKCGAEQKKREEEERKRREFMITVDRYKKLGFPDGEMQEWCFSNDDMSNPKVTQVMRRYVDNFAEMRKNGKGLLLHGTVGTGKTFAACEVANALIEKGYPALVTNFARLTNVLQGTWSGKQDYIDSLNEFDLIVIDDLGTERKSDYMQEMVYNIIDSRYRSGKPMIVTTNLALEEITDAHDIGNKRIYDRVLERCFPVEVKGASRRRKAVRDTYDDMKNLLGL